MSIMIFRSFAHLSLPSRKVSDFIYRIDEILQHWYFSETFTEGNFLPIAGICLLLESYLFSDLDLIVNFFYHILTEKL